MFRKRIMTVLLCIALTCGQTGLPLLASETEMLQIETEFETHTDVFREKREESVTESAGEVFQEPETEHVEALITAPETEVKEAPIVTPETEKTEEKKKPSDSGKKTVTTYQNDEKISTLAAEEGDDLKSLPLVDASTTLKNGTYIPEDFSFAGGTGKLKLTCDEIVVKDGKAYAKVGISSNSIYEVQWHGGVKSADAPVKEVEITVRLNEVNQISLKSMAMSSAHYILYTIVPTLTEPEEKETESEITGESESESESEKESETESEIETETEADPESESETEVQTEAQTEAPQKSKYFDKAGKLKSGEYIVHNVELAEGYKMFNIISCKLTSTNGKVMATLTLNGTGYDYLYPGTKEEALKANKKSWIPFEKDKNGHYTYTMPVDTFDQVVIIAARSKRYADEGAEQPWYDKGLIFHSSSLQKVGDTYTPPETEKIPAKETEKPTDEYPENTGGSTSAVNNSTNLQDGTYKPDSFGYSGGTGRLSISCTSILVQGGKAYAVITFSSGSIIYVKANGSKYSPTSQSSSASTFTIPVQLNGNTQVLACTTAMSKPHEVAYTISLGLKAAQDADKDARETESIEESAKNAGITEEHFVREESVPEIIGLTYTGSYKADEEKYFRLHYYKEGFKVLEISLEDTDTPDWTEPQPEVEKELNTDESKEEELPSLYEGRTVRYLLVPEGGELPAGIEKEMIVIQVPTDNIFCASEAAEVEIKELTKDHSEEMQLYSETDFAAYDSDDLFLDLLINDIHLAIVPSDILKAGKVSRIGNDLQLLTIPMIVDRSEEEDSGKASEEWKYVYAALLNAEQLLQTKE